MLSDYEHGLSLKLIEESSKNVDLAFIGLVYEVRRSGKPVEYKYEGDFIRHVEEGGKIGVPCAFVSGYESRKTGNGFIEYNKARQKSKDKEFFIVNGDSFNMQEWKSNLEYYFSQEKQSSYKFIGDDVTDYITLQINTQGDDFAKHFSHAEQWILEYLIDDYTFNVNINNLLETILKKEKVHKDNIEIIKVVLHVHTNRDPCLRCASTMSIFTRYLNDSVKNAINKNVYNRPLILVSSRTNYQERRFLAGHDIFFDKPFNISSQQEHACYYKAFVNIPRNYADNMLK